MGVRVAGDHRRPLLAVRDADDPGVDELEAVAEEAGRELEVLCRPEVVVVPAERDHDISPDHRRRRDDLVLSPARQVVDRVERTGPLGLVLEPGRFIDGRPVAPTPGNTRVVGAGCADPGAER